MSKPKRPKIAPGSSLFFSDGCFAGEGARIFLGHFNAYPDADSTRIAFRFGENWLHYDCPDDLLRSVTYSVADGRCFMAGRNGLMQTYGSKGKPFTVESVAGSLTESTIEDTFRFGEIFRVRTIADQIYCCGQSSQIYRFAEDRWVHADQGLLSTNALTLEDIDGSDSNDIYAVGLKGTIVHFDGHRWRALDSPTNQPLASVRCRRRGEVYICGNNGVLLRGNERGFELIGSEDFRMNFWDLAFVDDRIYVSHVNGLLEYKDGSFSKVELPDAQMSCNRLSVLDEHLLSTGLDDLWELQGMEWQQLVWPDNESTIRKPDL